MVRSLQNLSVFAVLLFAGAAAQATTIVSVGNPDPNFTPGLLVGEQEAISVSWTATNAYTNVSIYAPLGQGAANDANPVYAYLTTRNGMGTTKADEIATSIVYFTSAPDPTVRVFAGLNLGPGTYYLSLWSPVMAGGGWQFSLGPSIVLDDGVSLGDDQAASRYVGLDKLFNGNFAEPLPNFYVPASFYGGFQLLNEHMVFNVESEGAFSTTPEPKSIYLLGIPLIALALLMMNKKAKASILGLLA